MEQRLVRALRMRAEKHYGRDLTINEVALCCNVFYSGPGEGTLRETPLDLPYEILRELAVLNSSARSCQAQTAAREAYFAAAFPRKTLLGRQRA